ncbi:MAG TPA: hypothetical protein VJ698_12490 [Noviherbaspirillum sp.]|uniref:hypothetical protein n=1 Tax=Noviherbaspirillum sp. TaxID=1926288 RepID=UPI002B48CF7E|nr:hypothetical protein [Noviherbaspirillum sp.]HJV86283.1 hypothetical protein [Noviherbaspirillum sp.]
MKNLCMGVLLLTWSVASGAKPTPQIIQSCLRTESVAGADYIEINPGSFNQEDDEAGKKTFTTITVQGKEFGIWKETGSNRFGMVHAGKEIPIKRVIRLSSHAPSPFDPYTAQWGKARDTKSVYVCVTFNFEGLGESGSFQNVRGLYLLEMNNARSRIFYIVGDIRQ